jgi:methyl-accepting chemotaxis protein
MTSSPAFASLQAAADTVVMVQARDGLETAALVASVALTLTFVLSFPALIVLLLRLRRFERLVNGLLERFEKQMDPVFGRGREVVANLEFITGAVRADMHHVSDAMQSVSARLQNASDRMEQRVEEFNALMEVVQTEAEDLFIGSAAAIHGVRAGARALRAGDRGDGSELDEAGPLDGPDPIEIAASEIEEIARRSGGA